MPLPGSKLVFKNNHTFDQQATPRRLAVGAAVDNTDNNFEPKDLASYFKSINYNNNLKNQAIYDENLQRARDIEAQVAQKWKSSRNGQGEIP